MRKIAFILALIMLFLCSCGAAKEPAATESGVGTAPLESESRTTERKQPVKESSTEQQIVNAFYEKDFEKLASLGGVADEYRDGWMKKALALREATEFIYPAKNDISNVEYSVKWTPEAPLPTGRYVFVNSYPTFRFVPIEEKDEDYFPDGIEQDAFEFVCLFTLGHRNFIAALENGDPAPFYNLVFWARRDAEERMENGELHMTDGQFALGLTELTRIAISDFSPIDSRRDGTGYLYFSPRYAYSEGCVEPNRIEKVEKTENGYSVTVRSYADYFGFVPSDLYVISVSRSDGAYAWVLDGIRIIEEGELPPAEYPIIKMPTDTATDDGEIQGGSQLKTLEGTWKSADAPPDTLVITNVTDEGFDFEIDVYRYFRAAGTAKRDGDVYKFSTDGPGLEGAIEFDGWKIVFNAESLGSFAGDSYLSHHLAPLDFPNKVE